MKTCFIIFVLILSLSSVTGGEIPNNFLKSDKPEWQAYIKRYLVFPESRLTLQSLVECLKIPHVTIRGNDNDPHDIMTNMVLLSDTKLLPRQALWELKEQTGYNIDLDNRFGTLSINYPKRDILK